MHVYIDIRKNKNMRTLEKMTRGFQNVDEMKELPCIEVNILLLELNIVIRKGSGIRLATHSNRVRATRLLASSKKGGREHTRIAADLKRSSSLTSNARHT